MMGKLGLGVLVAMLAGCSGMGMGSGQYSSSGSGASSSATYSGDTINYNSASQQTVIDPRTGRLTLYHGG
jgi:hypothetical protein